jgi:hypothetical protein
MIDKKKSLRSVTGTVVDPNTVKTLEPMESFKKGDAVVVVHADDYRRTFESMMNRINEMDEKIQEQSKLLQENIVEEKGFFKRFRKQ